ncbi:MAG: methylmalonyl-CoA mutase [Myxococcales bacterium]|nr:methylmalonyl-CoA mutase [Myxococcales bacterium]MCB9708601.1 methylmalonyl-CoA mutase [Myxococcales bacterium]
MSGDLKQAFAEWRANLARFEAQHPVRERSILLSDGKDAECIYVPPHAPTENDYEAKLGFPGAFPFTRGVQPNMYRGRLWTMRQYAGFGDAEESNQRYRHLLEQGQTGLSVAFDLPTQMGRDSDHPLAQAEVGKVGVAIDTIDDMRMLLRGIDLNAISTSMTINATAPILLAFYVTVAKEQGVRIETLKGTVQNDILKEYIARGTYIYPVKESLRLSRDLFVWCAEHVPRWHPISVSGYHMREAGCDAAQEIAFTLSNAITYVKTAKEAGLGPNIFGRQLSFFFNAHNHLLEEVAKFRAARRMWATIMRDRFGATDPAACMLRFHAQTAGSTLQAHQPLVNAARVTLQALSAVLGGCQSLHANGYDEALSLPSQTAATLALRTQQVLAYESGVTDTVDPMGGSYAIEAMTDRLQGQAQRYLDHIEKIGGMPNAIAKGYVQKEIQNTAYQAQLEVESQKRVVVGTNRFKDESEPQTQSADTERAYGPRQIERLAAFRQAREPDEAARACETVRKTAMGDGNLMVQIVEAAQAGATLGEISDALRDAWGEYHPTAYI